MRARWFSLQPGGRKLAALAQLFELGKMRPTVGQVFPLGNIADAHRLSETGHSRGVSRVLCKPALGLLF